MQPLTRHKKLLENDKVRRWYENLEARSKLTAQTYLRNLGLWLEYLNLNPEDLIDWAKNDFDNLKGEIADQVRVLERKGTHGSSISTGMKPMISFLKFHNVSIKLNINIKNENRNLKKEKERIPDKEELSKILRISSLRERVAISLMAFSGLRPEVLGNIDGTDGLTISDIEDLVIKKDRVEFKNVPVLIRVKHELSKIRQSYFTFVGTEGTQYLKEYLEDRLKRGEEIKPDSAVIKPGDTTDNKDHTFLQTTLLLRRIKFYIKRAGYDWRPYIFRVYFGTNLDTAETKGKISHAWRQFIMGHKGDIEETYTKREGKIEEGRESYKECLPFIETVQKGISPEQAESIEHKMKVMVLLTVGFSDMEAEELSKLPDDEYWNKVREKKGMNGLNGRSQKVISISEVAKYIDSGYEFVSSLPNNMAVIRVPK